MGVSVHVCLAPAGAEPRAAAHTLLLALAGTLVDGPSLSHDETGRPHVPGLAVSITHTHRLVAVAASSDGPLGIDLEELQPREFAPLADRWFTPRELAWMDRQSDKTAAFLHLWTAKEAVGKALGLGLRSAGLRRPMPLPDEDAAMQRGALYADIVAGEPSLAVLHVATDEPAVLAIAASTGVAELVIHQETALRSVVRSRTSFPVVVRGN